MKNKLNKSKKQSKNKSLDFFILFIFIISMIVPIIISTSQQYIVQYGDDISTISWARDHSIFDIFTSKLGTGYRPIMNLFYSLGYILWGSEAMYYYLFSGIMFSIGMVFLYFIGKELHSKIAGIIAVLLYLFLDASFILVSKINFIVTTGEIMFITSALYFAISYFKSNKTNYNFYAIILSILAFLTKEPSILIIPTVILTYLYFEKRLDTKYIILCIIPFIYVFVEMIFISPDVGGGGGNLFQRISNNLNFYYGTEVESQFKSPILLIFSIIIATYSISYHNLRKEIMLCLAWFIVGILPFLVTQQPVQPTYLAEANIGMVLLIGIVVSQSFKKIDYITGLIVIGIILQVTVIPIQITNMQNYNKMISDNQNTFLETMLEIKNIPETETIFYISNNDRTINGGFQITEGFFKQYLCLKNMCNANITTNYENAKYVILPSSSDIQIFQIMYPNEKLEIIKQIQHNNEYGFILKKV
jgi:hypothetical protein